MSPRAHRRSPPRDPATVLLTIAALLLLHPLSAHARTQAEEDAPPPMEEVEALELEDLEAQVEELPIEGDPEVHSQVASFAVTSIRASPAVVTHISREDIRNSGARDLVDVLLLVPGFFFGVDVNNAVGAGFRGMWGHEGKVLLLVDGKEMNEQLYSTLQFGNELPIDLVERVEVIRGPGSVIYGGNAELAVVNVVTRSLQGGRDALVSATWGQLENSYGRRSLTVSGRALFEGLPGFSAFASASVGQGQRSDARYEDTAGTRASMAGVSNVDPSLLHAGVGYRDFQASVLYHRYQTTGITGFGEVVRPAQEANFQSLHADASYTLRLHERFTLTPRVNAIVQEPWQNLDVGSDYFYDKQVRRFRARLVAQWAPFDLLRLTLGGDGWLDQARLNTPAEEGPQTAFLDDASRVEYQNVAAFVEASSFNPVVDVVAGARYDRHSLLGDSFVPRLVLMRSLGPFSAKALYSRAFRAPGVENIALGDDVRPERTTVYEVEAAVELGEAQRVAVNAFDVGITDPILYFYDPVTEEEGYRNFRRQGSQGVEFEYRLRLERLRLHAGYSFYRPSGLNDVNPYLIAGHRNMFAAMPNHRASLAATVKPLRWLSVSPSAIFVGKRYWTDASGDDGSRGARGEEPAQLLLNLFVRAQDVGIKGLELGAGVYNLLGTDFRVAQPFNGGHAPLPILSREFLLRATYVWEPRG